MRRFFLPKRDTYNTNPQKESFFKRQKGYKCVCITLLALRQECFVGLAKRTPYFRRVNIFFCARMCVYKSITRIGLG